MSKKILVFGLAMFLFFGCTGFVEQFTSPGAISVWQQKDEGDWNIRYSLWSETTKSWYVPGGGKTALVAELEGDDHDPYVDSNGADTAVSVWSHVKGTDADIYYSVWKANAWSGAAPVAELSGYDSDPAVAMDTNGNAMAIWVRKGADGSRMLYYSKYNNGGWGSPAPVTRLHNAVSLPEISYSSTFGAYVAVWTASNGNGTRVYASGYGNGTWVAPVEIPGQTVNAVLDNNVPTNERIGLGASGNKREAAVVWKAGGDLYSSTWTPSGWSTAVKFAQEKMPDVEYEYGGVPYAVFIKGGDLHWTNDIYFGRTVNAVPGTGSDYRPAITFIGDRKIGLSVFWTTAAAPSEIYYTRWSGAWEPVAAIDPANVPGEDRNPALAPIMKDDQVWEDYFDWCGDKVIQWPNIWGMFEECEVGIPCADPRENCDETWCLCWRPVTANLTWCGDGIIQKPNSAGQMEQCEADADCAQGQTCVNCVCMAGEAPPDGSTHKECVGEKCTRVQGTGEDSCTADEQCRMPEMCGNGKVEGNEQCDIGAGTKPDGSFYPAARDTCTAGTACSECVCRPGVVTPRCGDGYISHMFTGGGGTEECDLGGKYGAPNLTDTCEPPATCSRITCRCELPPQEDDGIHYVCVEGGCVAQDGEGPNECLRDSQCRHKVCGEGGTCIELMYKGESECDTNAQCRHGECRDDQCVEILEPGDDECDMDADCWHGECTEGVCEQVAGPGEDECDVDADCSHYACLLDQCVLIEFPGQDSCRTNADCYVELCGNGRMDPGEDCDGEGPCGIDGVCVNCECVEPPELDCGDICGATSGADVIGQGLSTASACDSEADGYYSSPDCYTTCTYSWFYKVTNVAGWDSCCCGMVKRFPCSDCPGMNPECPGGDICSRNAPSWYEP